MEKKYLIGYMFGKPYLRFDDIQNFNEEADENGDIHVTFEDKDGAYHYVQCAGGFKEVDNRAPEIERYEVRGRRTIKRNGLDTAMAEVKPEEYQERRNRAYNRLESNEGEGWGVEDLDYSYIDNNDTGYQGEDFIDELLINEPVDQVMEEQTITSPEEFLDYYVSGLAEGGIGVPDEYREMLLNKIKVELGLED